MGFIREPRGASLRSELRTGRVYGIYRAAGVRARDAAPRTRIILSAKFSLPRSSTRSCIVLYAARAGYVALPDSDFVNTVASCEKVGCFGRCIAVYLVVLEKDSNFQICIHFDGYIGKLNI